MTHQGLERLRSPQALEERQQPKDLGILRIAGLIAGQIKNNAQKRDGKNENYKIEARFNIVS